MGAFTQEQPDQQSIMAAYMLEPDVGARKKLLDAFGGGTKTSLSPIGQLGVAGLSGGLGALGQVLVQNQQFNQQKELLDYQRQQQRLSPQQSSAVLGLASRFSRAPQAGPMTAQSSLGPGQGAQSAQDLERRLAEMRQRLSAIRK